MAKSDKPLPVTVGDLKATAHRPPTSSDPRWSWRCRKATATIWTGRARREDVVGILIAILQAPAADPERDRIETVGQLVAAWMLNEIEPSSRAHTTLRVYRTVAARINRLAGGLALNRGRWAMGEVWRLLEAEGRCSHRTMAYTCKILLSAWRWAHGYGFVADPPPPAPRRKAPPPPRRHTPSLDDALVAIESIAEPSRSILTVQLATGARISEVCMVERADVDDDGDRMVLTFGRHEGARKTGERRVPVTMPAAVAAIRAALGRMVADSRIAGRIWTRRDGRPVATGEKTYTSQRLFRLDWTALGVEPFTSHGLRRLAVTQLRQAGVPLEVAAGLLGHSIDVMLKIYRQIAEGERLDAMERARLGEAPGVESVR